MACHGIGAICLGCEKEYHAAHRINELKLLFVDIKNRRPFIETDSVNRIKMFESLMEAKCRIEDSIKALEELSKKCDDAIRTAREIKFESQFDWFSQLNRVVDKAMNCDSIAPSLSKEFCDILNRIDFQPQEKLKQEPTIECFLQLNTAYNRSLNMEAIHRISTIAHGRRSPTLEDFVV